MVEASLGITHDALRARNVELPDSLVAMSEDLISNHRTREGRKDDDAYYATDGSL